MSDNGWSHGGLSATGIAEVLEGFAIQGGHLLGARRWSENPLTLTHVRWMGPRGEVGDAVRPPGGDEGVPPEERDVWVQLALGFPAMHPSPAGRDAPWLPLDVSPQHAGALLLRLARAHSTPHSGYGPAYGSGGPGYVSGFDPRHGSYHRETSAPGTPPISPPHMTRGTYTSDGPTAGLPPFTPPPSAPQRHGDAGGAGGYGMNQGMMGDLNDAVLFDEGVSVIPCVEIEQPTAVGSASSEAGRAFARDAAATFVRASRGLRHVREIRGWMRGGRLVLAARLIVAPGSGAASPAEREDAVRQLAQVLAQRTLPYAHIGEADPGEWARGRTLTE